MISYYFLRKSNYVLQSNRIKKLVVLLGFFYLYCIPASQLANAQWSPNSAVSVDGGGHHPGIINDGAGGSITAWYTGSYVGATKINAAGVIQWSVIAGAGMGQQVPVSIVSDGEGGAFLAWIGPGFSLYTQHVNATGALQWTSSGLLICSGTNSAFDPSIVGDGAGSAIVSWFDSRNTNSIYAQHINAAGNVDWITNGVAICSGTSPGGSTDSYGPETISDGSGGAIISWADNRNGNYDIYAQRINAAGNIQWQLNGIPICSLSSSQTDPGIISDRQSGAIITWTDNRNGNNDIYGQRIDGAGVKQWAVDGIGICTWGGTDFSSTIVGDATGGAVVVGWVRNNGLYAQKINLGGILQWSSGPVAFINVAGGIAQSFATDGAGGAIATWMQFLNSNYDIYAQRITASGLATWPLNGINVSMTSGIQEGYPSVTDNGSQGAIVCWNNSPGFGGTYAQNVNDDGTVGPAAMFVNGCPAGNVTIMSNITGATYQWQVDTGSGFANISNNGNYSGTSTAMLQLNNVPSAWYGYIYRCIVNGFYSNNSKLKISDTWTGAVNANWENASNWMCGTVPDAGTDVIINKGSVLVNTNTTVRTLTLATGVNFTVAPGVTLTVLRP